MVTLDKNIKSVKEVLSSPDIIVFEFSSLSALLPFYYGGADYRVLLCEPRYSRYNIYRNNGHAYFFAFGRRFPDTDRFAVYVGFRFL